MYVFTMWLAELPETIRSLRNNLVKAKNVAESVYNVILSQASSSYVPPKADLVAVEKNRQAFWDKLEAESGIELVNHLRAFCEYDPETNTLKLTRASMFAGLKKLGVTTQDGKLIVAASELLPKLKDFHGSHFDIHQGLNSPFSPNDGPALVHPHDTGFFDRDGKFDAERFANLIKFATVGQSGKLVISRAKFDECKKYLDTKDWNNYYNRWKDASLLDKGVGYIGNLGEVGSMFDALSSELIDGVPHAALDDIEAFYRNTAKVMKDEVTVCEAAPIDRVALTTCQQKQDLLDKMLAAACQYAKGVVDATPLYRSATVIDGNVYYNPTLFCQNVNRGSQQAINPPQPAPMIGK